MADAEARKKMMEAALLLQNEFKNPEPDPFRKKKGPKASKGRAARQQPFTPPMPTMPTIPNRAPARVPGLARPERAPHHTTAATMSRAAVANPRMPSATSITSASNPIFVVRNGPSPGMRDNKAQDWLSSKPAPIKMHCGKATPARGIVTPCSTTTDGHLLTGPGVVQSKLPISQPSKALEDVSNMPASERTTVQDKLRSQGPEELVSSVWANDNDHGNVLEKKSPLEPGSNLTNDLMDLDDEFLPGRNRLASNPEDLLDLNAPVAKQEAPSAGGDTAFDLFKLLIEAIEEGKPMGLGEALERVDLGVDSPGDHNWKDDDDFEPARFLAAVEDFVKGDSSQDQVHSLLDSAVGALPALKKLRALSPQKRCRCRTSTKAVYGLSASKYNDDRGENTAADAQNTLFRYVIASAQQGATRRAALQVLLWYHDPECPDVQLAAQAYPILFGASPATTERADADPDGGLVVIKADRNDGHVDDDLDDELMKECEGRGFRENRYRHRNRKGAQQGHADGITGHGEVSQGFGFNNGGFGYKRETQACTFDGEQSQAGYDFDRGHTKHENAFPGVGREATVTKKKTPGGLSSSRWA
ncbi:hypothetical protein ACHAQH_007681 [Verticillium albo-atrum]